MGDLPGGVRDSGDRLRQRAETVERHESADSDVLDLSSAAQEANQASQSIGTNPVGIEPNPSPKPRPDSSDRGALDADEVDVDTQV